MHTLYTRHFIPHHTTYERGNKLKMEQALELIKSIMKEHQYSEMYYAKKALFKRAKRVQHGNDGLMLKKAHRLFLDNDLQIINVDDKKVLIKELDFEGLALV